MAVSMEFDPRLGDRDPRLAGKLRAGLLKGLSLGLARLAGKD
jgi:hypothetical protein